ncbi:protein tyrosine kinase [Paraburkholderia ginsengiterrae]|uniref:Putative tyrosine-protein kinase EpsB n=1 Tax=Paraburkholderia ginsengiterrae TaxID=1462993 RepID=A0A1A9N254_9BURK|nr:polysaccharide biosynthesis tyrosine autokinase [Paraburkholderia ginsengiterrae]OAJ53136.1 protein tyrosine kinase [Paraburkholderia ginsengiterrae]OAJ55835.1 protein tyrosine kinase [Paraburkholderia ginsengiterrae]
MKLLHQELSGQAPGDKDIALSDLVALFVDSRRLIALVVTIALMSGMAYAFLSTPMYRADAMIQVDSDAGSSTLNDKLGDLASLFQDKASTDAEIELIRSRKVVEEAVRSLRLDVKATPQRFPLIGALIARHAPPGVLADPVLGMSRFAWGGERLGVTQFDIPSRLYDKPFKLMVGAENTFDLRDPDGRMVLHGRVGAMVQGTTPYGPVQLRIEQMTARAGTSFHLTRASTQLTTADLQLALDIGEKAKQSGIVSVKLDGADAALTAAIVNSVASIYVQRNVDSKSAQAQQMLQFLSEQLPQLRADLDQAEAKYNAFRAENGTVDLETEGKLLLQSIVDGKTRVIELQQQRAALAQRYTAEHPSVQAIDRQIGELEQQQNGFNQKVASLPSVQQQALRLMRDVRVDTDLYTKLLDSTQQLRVLKAGQLGNVHTVDYAEVAEKPVRPKKALVIVLSGVIGLMLGCLIAFVRSALNRGLETPSEIESAVGVPVYAIVSRSARQQTLQRSGRSGAAGLNVLAVARPDDVAVEGIRSLRTALQFGLLKSHNNIVMLTGPRPDVGKSFMSVNLSAVLSAGGKRVLLIDSDMRRGDVHEYFALPRKPGLSDVIGGADPNSAVHRQVLPNLDVLMSGSIASSPAEMLMSDVFGALLAQFSRQYDVVIVDSPPVLAVTDPVLIGKHAGLTLLVVRHGRHSAAELQESMRQLSSAGRAVDGVLLNDVPQRASTYGAFSEYGPQKSS